jgi:ribosomal protein S18 acetylase RimI-like enzyme
MGTEWQVETLTADDYAAVRTLWIQAGLPVKAGGRESQEQFIQQLAGATQSVLGVRGTECLIGVVIATHDGRKGWINRLAVHPDYRRRGVARRLIAEAEHMLQSQGLHIIAALIEDGNEASLALFQRAGYQDYPGIHYLTKRESDDV